MLVFQKTVRKAAILTLINSKTNKTVTIPVHTGVDIGKGLLKKIITDAGLTTEEFVNLL